MKLQGFTGTWFKVHRRIQFGIAKMQMRYITTDKCNVALLIVENSFSNKLFSTSPSKQHKLIFYVLMTR